jgi:hypothetical protein
VKRQGSFSTDVEELCAVELSKKPNARYYKHLKTANTKKAYQPSKTLPVAAKPLAPYKALSSEDIVLSDVMLGDDLGKVATNTEAVVGQYRSQALRRTSHSLRLPN